MEELYREFEKLTMNNEPLAVAGIMMAQSLKIYKTILSDEEYVQMTKHILGTVDTIEPIDEPRLH